MSSMTVAEQIAALEIELSEINTAISLIRKGGQSYTIGTGSSNRNVSQADYKTLIQEKREIQNQILELEGNAGIALSAGW